MLPMRKLRLVLSVVVGLLGIGNVWASSTDTMSVVEEVITFDPAKEVRMQDLTVTGSMTVMGSTVTVTSEEVTITTTTIITNELNQISAQ